MKKKTKILLSLLMAFAMLLGGIPSIKAAASGRETLPVGAYSVGGFTFTNYNLTPVKTMPNNARTLRFEVVFRKADKDAGVGKVKLTVQIRNSRGQAVCTKVVEDTSGWNGIYFNRGTQLKTSQINVSPGEKYQIFFDASSVDPAHANGKYRSIEVISFTSFINS